MTSTQKDGLLYVGGAAVGTVLAKSFGAKLFGLALGGTAGIALAAWAIMNKTKVSGESF
ncbi:MAG TPA: hypothetical protein VF077_09810 [Nitrospiraceae bacterium]